MRKHILNGFHLLIVEDEALCAFDLCESFRDVGATILGPAKSIKDALALLAKGPAVDGAVLDINLRGEMVFPVAAALAQRGIPFVFATGHTPETLPQAFSSVPNFQKPVNTAMLADALDRTISAFLSPSQRRRREMGLDA